jgi:hypothetical protein
LTEMLHATMQAQPDGQQVCAAGVLATTLLAPTSLIH